MPGKTVSDLCFPFSRKADGGGGTDKQTEMRRKETRGIRTRGGKSERGIKELANS